MNQRIPERDWQCLRKVSEGRAIIPTAAAGNNTRLAPPRRCHPPVCSDRQLWAGLEQHSAAARRFGPGSGQSRRQLKSGAEELGLVQSHR